MFPVFVIRLLENNSYFPESVTEITIDQTVYIYNKLARK